MRDGGAATTGVGRVALGARGVAAALVVGAALGVGAGLGVGAAARARTVTARGSTTIRSATGGSVIRVAGNDCIAECDMPAMTGRCGGIRWPLARRYNDGRRAHRQGRDGRSHRRRRTRSPRGHGGDIRIRHRRQRTQTPQDTDRADEKRGRRRNHPADDERTAAQEYRRFPNGSRRGRVRLITARCGTAASATGRPLRRPRAARRCRSPTAGAQVWTLAASPQLLWLQPQEHRRSRMRPIHPQPETASTRPRRENRYR